MSLPVAVRDAMEEDIVAEAANTLQLDARQRAMLQEMGVRLWLPPSEPEVEAAVEVGVGAMAAATPAKADAATAIQHTPAQAVEQAFAPTAQKQQPPTNTASAPPAQHDAALPQAAMMLSGQPLPAVWAAEAPPRWLFVLDALAADSAAAPLQGDAGKLLLNMAAAIRLRPEQGCCVQAPHCVPRPGQAMDAAALQQSIAWLQREIVRVQPQVVIALGRHAACSLLGQHRAFGATARAGASRGRVRRRVRDAGSAGEYPRCGVVPLGLSAAHTGGQAPDLARPVLGARLAGGCTTRSGLNGGRMPRQQVGSGSFSFDLHTMRFFLQRVSLPWLPVCLHCLMTSPPSLTMWP